MSELFPLDVGLLEKGKSNHYFEKVVWSFAYPKNYFVFGD